MTVCSGAGGRGFAFGVAGKATKAELVALGALTLPFASTALTAATFVLAGAAAATAPGAFVAGVVPSFGGGGRGLAAAAKAAAPVAFEAAGAMIQ